MEGSSRLDDLAAFLRVAEAGGFSAAARTTGRPLSTLSRRVAALEAGLGEPLIRRGARGFALTARGDALLREARDAIRAAEAALAGGEAPLAGPLRVSCAAYTARTILAPALLGFAQAHPEVTLDLVLTNAPLDLTEHGIDLAIRSGTLPDGALRQRKLRETAFGVFSAAPGDALTPEDIRAGPAIVTPPLLDWTFADARGRPDRLRPRPALTVNDLDLAAQAARAGLGLAYLPEEMGAAYGLATRIVAGVDPYPRPLLALWPAGPVRAPKVDALIAMLLGQAAAEP